MLKYIEKNILENTDFTKTANFKSWFGKSKVVDKSGKPLVVYHGTKTNIQSFKPSTKMGNQGETDQFEGIYFTDSFDGASFFSLSEDDPRFMKQCYLRLEKPYRAKDVKELFKVFNTTSQSEVGQLIRKSGYDGLIIEQGFYANGGPYKLFLAFSPNQIKSATDNNGNFSKSSTNIYESSLEEATLDSNYLKWKKDNVTYRGMKTAGVDNEVYGSFGKGLYTVPLSNKAMAKTYGDLYFVVNAIPKKPKVVRSLNEAELFRQELIMAFCKKNNESYSPAFFESKTSVDKEALKLGFDGLIIKGREMVNYTPKNIKYFKNEQDLINYYNTLNEDTTNKQSSLQESRKLLHIKIYFNQDAQCFNLTCNDKTKYFFGTTEDFTKFLRNNKAMDSTTKPISKRQVTYRQMVDAILSKEDNTVVMWNSFWDTISHRSNTNGGY